MVNDIENEQALLMPGSSLINFTNFKTCQIGSAIENGLKFSYISFTGQAICWFLP